MGEPVTKRGFSFPQSPIPRFAPSPILRFFLGGYAAFCARALLGVS
jgi:hypothetical protein